VAADLSEPWAGALAAAGFDPAVPTAWLVEGLLVYLRARDAEAVLETVGSLSAPGSALSLTYGEGLARLVAGSAADDPFRQVSDLFQGGLAEPADAWLTRHGWHVTARPKTELAASYGRPLAHPSDASFLIARRPA
jgi:methyltransferase (TIGR00027 family)